MNMNEYFMPYQTQWILDESRYKQWDKSRRIGATYVEAYGKTRKAVKTPKLDVWVSTADESAAKEYILYVEQWAKLFKKAGEILSITDEVIDEKDNVTALTARFANGSRIIGLASRPEAFRSKGGDVDLDEFDWHKDQKKMWAAAKPVVMWGGDIALMSTRSKKGTLFDQFIETDKKRIKQGLKPVFSHHRTTIFDAVAQGLLDRILGHPTTKKEREDWIEMERVSCGDDDIWRQEYCCEAVDESESFITWEMIKLCEHPDAGKPELAGAGPFYVGMDIARRRDLTVIWVIEMVGDVAWTREVVKMKNKKFAEQDEELDRINDKYNPRRFCLDQGGMGEKPVEDAQKRYGEHRVEGVIFTNLVKHDLATTTKRKMEGRETRIPEDKDTRAAHKAVKKITTSAGNIRYDAERTDKGHADEFWAHCLALHAAENSGYEIEFMSTGTKRESFQTIGSW